MYNLISNQIRGAAQIFGLFALAIVLLPGCATKTTQTASGVRFLAAGDPGVELRMIVTRGGTRIMDQKYTVPADIQLNAGDLDIAFIQGGTTGNLTVKGLRDGLLLSVGSTGEVGAITEFKVRKREISMNTMSAQAAAASGRF